MIGATNDGLAVSITGLGCKVPDRVVTNVALAQAYGMLAGGLAKRALVVGGDLLSRILDWQDRSTLVLFGDGAGAAVLEAVPERGFIGFELGADGAGGANLWLPGSGSRLFD